MMSLPDEKKWQLYCSQKGVDGSDGGSDEPEAYVDAVRNLESGRVDSLVIALRTQPNSFVMRFIEDWDGLSAILDALASMDYQTGQGPVHTALLGCLKALMNHSVSKTLLKAITVITLSQKQKFTFTNSFFHKFFTITLSPS